MEGGGGGGGATSGVAGLASEKFGRFWRVCSETEAKFFSSVGETGVGRSKRTVGVTAAEEGAIGFWDVRSRVNLSSSTIPGRSGRVRGTFI